MPVGGSQLVQQANEHVTYYKSLKKSGCTSVVPNRLGKVFPVPGNSIPIRLGMLFPTVGKNRDCSKGTGLLLPFLPETVPSELYCH